MKMYSNFSQFLKLMYLQLDIFIAMDTYIM